MLWSSQIPFFGCPTPGFNSELPYPGKKQPWIAAGIPGEAGFVYVSCASSHIPPLDFPCWKRECSSLPPLSASSSSWQTALGSFHPIFHTPGMSKASLEQAGIMGIVPVHGRGWNEIILNFILVWNSVFPQFYHPKDSQNPFFPQAQLEAN